MTERNNVFMIFHSRNMTASDLNFLAENIKLLATIIKTENSHICNEEFLKSEKDIKELVDLCNAKMKTITEVLLKEKENKYENYD